MSDQAAALAAEQEVNPPPSEAAFSSQESVQERDWDAEARAQGWVPEQEFRGSKKPAKFLDAKTFVERGEEIRPFLDSRTKRLHTELSKKQQEFDERVARMEKMNQAAMAAAERRHKEELARVKAEQRRAAEAGDLNEFDRLENVKANLELTAPKAEQAPAADPQADLQAKIKKFADDNPWFRTNMQLRSYAKEYSLMLSEDNPNQTFEENTAQLLAHMREAFPDQLGGPKRASNGHSAVDGGSAFPGARGKQGLADKLPSEAVRQADADVKAGLYKNREEWAKVYFEK